MRVAVYNPALNTILTWVTEPSGTLPDGFEFREESNVPANASFGPTATPEPVPAEVSLRQFLMAADRSGLLATLEALKTSDGIPQQTRRDIYFFLEYSNFIERNHPLISQLAPIVGVTEAQVDDLFRAAAQL